MPIIIANPIGFWALLGIPIILLIHFLQRQSIILPSSTLFMLDAIDRQSIKGQKLDHLRNSIPLWLQLLAVAILTWLLIEPRWTRTDSIQRIVIVLDSSASMEPFKEDAREQLKAQFSKLTGPGSRISYTVLESHQQGEKLFRGESLNDMLDSLETWAPSSSAHSNEATLRVGRSLAGTAGSLIYVTDHVENSLPFGAKLFSVGSPIANIGFTGLSTGFGDGQSERPTWQATVKNYSDTTQSRDWFLAIGQQRTASRNLTLESGETRTLTGKFPADSDRITLMLNADQFVRDDHIHVLVPKPKPILVGSTTAPNANELTRGVIDSIINATLFQGSMGDTESEKPDLVFSTYNPLQPKPHPPVSVVFLNQVHVPREFVKGTIIAANLPLISNLNWQGLIARSTPSIPLSDQDTPLLWQGDRALIFLRESGEIRQLIFNFDVIQSNASRLPAFIVLINRYVNLLRREKIALEKSNLELNQLVYVSAAQDENAPDLTLKSADTEFTIPKNRAGVIRAPSEPGFFKIFQGGQTLLEASSNFADTREADFSNAASRSDLAALPQEIAEKRSASDPAWQAWLLGIIILSLLSWHFLNPPTGDLKAPASGSPSKSAS